MKVEIWSDIVCPWCYIGKRRFEEALETFGEDVAITWRSFELAPGAPKQADMPLDEALARKYGMGLERAREMMDHMTEMARQEGLSFDFSKAQSGNSFDAHRLLHLADRHDLGGEMKERLLQAYFTEGRSISERDVLVGLAVEVGLDEETARTTLDSGEFGAEVRQDEAAAMELGVRGVPFFVIDGKYGVSGAQSADVFVDVLEKARADRQPGPSEDGDRCDGERCD